MKQTFLNKIITGVLAISVLSGCAMSGYEETPENKKQDEPEIGRHEAYKQIVQNTLDEYGIYSIYDVEGFDNTGSEGLWEAKELDITGDNEDELMLLYIDDDRVNFEVYEFNNGFAKLAWFNSYENTGAVQVGVNRQDGRVFWGVDTFIYLNAETVAYIDGKYLSASRRPYDERYDGDADFDNTAYLSHHYGDMAYFGISLDAEREHLWNVDSFGTDVSAKEMIEYWGLVPPVKTHIDILGEVPYYGDKSKCKMTKEMALAYAESVMWAKENAQKLDFESGTYAVLVDFAGDGIPLLVTASMGPGGDISYTNEAGYYFYIWQWDGEKAVKYDFNADCDIHITDMKFAPGNSTAMITVSDGDVFTGYDPGGRIEYTVSNGMITKKHHYMQYTATVYNDTMTAMGEYIPDSVKGEDYEETAEVGVEKLEEIGWGGYESINPNIGFIFGFYIDDKCVPYSEENKSIVNSIGIDDTLNIFDSYAYDLYAVQEKWTYCDYMYDSLQEYAETDFDTAVIKPVPVVVDFTKTTDSGYYLMTLIKGLMPDDASKTDIAEYIRICVEEAGKISINSKYNRITVSENTIYEALENATRKHHELMRVLEAANITLNKTVEKNVVISCADVNLDKVFYLTIPYNTAIAIENAGKVTFTFDGNHYVSIIGETAWDMVRTYGDFTVCVQRKSENVYTLAFMDSDGNEIINPEYEFTFSVPADGQLSTVEAIYAQGTDNWGGQYDESTGAITFSTRYPGDYRVVNNDADISDIGSLSEDEKEAIEFMVSKGYFALDGDKFNPDGTLTRYVFSEALVRIFFALDRTLTTSFTDVPTDSYYYPFVASGEHKNIIYGFDDNTFGGDKAVTVEEVLAFASRTLTERKGYLEPENVEDYLDFTDANEISGWARASIALAVREGLIEEGGELNPMEPISNKDAALILYRLFMLLYEVTPTEANTAVSPAPTQPTGGFGIKEILIISGIALLLIGLIITLVIVIKTKKKKENK